MGQALAYAPSNTGGDAIAAGGSVPAESRPGSLVAVLKGLIGLGEDAIARARLVERESGERLDCVVTRLGLVSEQALAEALASATGLPLVGRADFPVKPVAGIDLSLDFLLDARVVPLAGKAGRLIAAVSNPFEVFASRALEFAFGMPVDLCVARASDIEAAAERLYREHADNEVVPDAALDDDDLERLKDVVSDAPVIRAVNRLIAQALDQHASDIHVEPTDDGLAVRFRIDGMLALMPALPAAMRASFVSRIKIMAGLDIAEKRRPQDGRLRHTVRGHEIDLRVATAPSIHGESVVMRILDKSSLALDFAALGFDPALTGALRRAIQQPHGIILVTGPTGSGKTTTLYSALAELNTADRKLLTIEDPIEYRLNGIVQSQVNTAIDYTFSSALRSFLRQDPDVIMVGEIRDTETAQIAVQAALTGHLILSTLHTNTAIGAVSRLTDMGVEPFLLSSVLRAVLAQRLVRRLCVACKVPFDAGDALAELLGPESAAAHSGEFHRPHGCEACKGTGYAGRVAIFELLPVDDSVASQILHGADPRAIVASARQAGMISLLDDGLTKAARGITSIEEILRAARTD